MKINQPTLTFLFLTLFVFGGATIAHAQKKDQRAREFMKSKATELKLSPDDIDGAVVSDMTFSKKSGVAHYYLQQQYQGIPVYNSIFNVHFTKEDKVLTYGNRFVSDLKSKVKNTNAILTQQQAVEAAARSLGYIYHAPLPVKEDRGGPAREVLFDKSYLSEDDIPVKLVYQPVEDGNVYLAWQVTIHEPAGINWWSARVDASTGKLLDKNNYVISCGFGEPGGAICTHEAGGAHQFLSPVNPALAGGYNVFPPPVESPSHGARALVTNPEDPTASPFGWHDTDGAAGAEFTITRGNNVYALLDADANNATLGVSPDGGPMLLFDFPYNVANHPSTQTDAAITNLFFWNNYVHDFAYKYGFDEVNGNFQENNYGRGGLGADFVYADAQDGSGTNNANFGTPPDGHNPRMQMFIWSFSISKLTVNSPAGIAGDYVVGTAAFGPQTFTVTNDLVLATDGVGATNDGCTALTNAAAIAGKIAVIDRGACNFTVKVKNAQNAGAIGVVIVNNAAGAPGLAGSDLSITIPTLSVSLNDGNTIKAEMAMGTVNATLRRDPPVFLDSDLDNGVIAHEYGHGISNRLTGGPSLVGCLSNAEQMGEGWSDFFALMTTIEPGDGGADKRGIGTHLLGQPTTGNGIRPTPYSTDMAINPSTYGWVANPGGAVPNISQPHGIGYVWASMIWDLNWALIGAHGASAGFDVAMNLVMEGMKLQPCSPGFVDGRNAIIAADAALYDGANVCLIWEVFARRGLGYSAGQGSSNNRFDGVEAFDLPPDYTVVVTPKAQTVCPGELVLFDVSVVSCSSSTAHLTVTGLPVASAALFFPSNISTPGNSTLGIVTGAMSAGTYPLVVTATGPLGAESYNVTLTVRNPAPPAPTLAFPPDMSVGEITTPVLGWNAVAGEATYNVQVATDAGFSNIVANIAGVGSTQTSVNTTLNNLTTYYWRVQATNECGDGVFSAVWSFTTGSFGCDAVASTDVPKAISPLGPSVTTSTLTYDGCGTIQDVNVIGLDIAHTWIDDITVDLTSPGGTTRRLMNQPCTSQDNILINFDDEAASASFPCPPVQNLFYIPNQSLSAFDGEDPNGVWTLTVTDLFDGDGGSIKNWGLTICTDVPKVTCYLDNDGDNYGQAGSPMKFCAACGVGYAPNSDDCNDNNPSMYPGNVETCDAVDNDCDGQLNEGALLTFYRDADADGYGNPAISLQHCSPPDGYVANNSDCNDANAAVNPAATEVCDGQDNNCNGYTDDNDGTLVDTQEPTVACKPFTAALGANGQKTISPQDVLAGYTDNCFIINFSLSESSFNCANIGANMATLTATDRKGNSASCTAIVTVVDNTAPSVSCKDASVALDENGNGSITTASVLANVNDACGSAALSLDKSSFDCGDAGANQVILTATDSHGNSSACSATVNVTGNPALENDNPETCNGLDDNCNGAVDEGFDQDGDGFTSCGGDCDDSDAAINPAAPELCNGLDDNCNGQVDEEFDADGDGFTPCGGDCNDGNPAIYPGAPELCNGLDDDCNGEVDDGLSGIVYVGNVPLSTQAQVDAWLPCFGSIDGNLTITGLGIVDLGPLANLVSVTGDVGITVTRLPNLRGLEGLASIGGDLTIQHNGKLETLDGLENLASVGGDLALTQNKTSATVGLKDCCAIYDLLNGSGIGGAKSIFFNNSGCDSYAEIMADCGSDLLIGSPLRGLPGTSSPVKPEIGQPEMAFVPNPANDEVTIQFQGMGGAPITLTIYDHLGRVVLIKDLEEGQTRLKLSLKDDQFNEGIYLVNAILDGQRLVKRLVVVK